MKAKKLLSGLICSIMAISTTVCSFTAPVSAVDDDFIDLNQSQITEAMGAGWNLGNQFDAYSNKKGNETAWVNTPVKKELIDAVKNAGFKSIRIPVTYMGRIGAAPDYTIETAWLDRVQEVVDWAIEDELYVIINIHHDGNDDVNNGAWLVSSDEDQTEIKAKFKACWEQISAKFADYDEHLIFESMNEIGDGDWGNPSGQSRVYDNINDYNQIFVDAVRKSGGNNARRWLLIPGWYTNINYTVGDYGFKIPDDSNRDSSIPADEQRIMISVHYYDPYYFCLQETDAVSEWGTSAEIQALKDQFARCYSKFVLNGYPVVVGEYGSIDKTIDWTKNGISYKGNPDNEASRILYANEVCKAARSMGIIPVYWDNGWNGGAGFGLFDRSSVTVTQQGIIDGIMDAYEGEPEPTPVIVAPLPKDQALALVYYTKSSQTLTTVASGIADASMAGAVQVRYVLDCASDTEFDQYSTIRLSATIAGTKSTAAVAGESDVAGATNCTAVLNLTKPIKNGDSYTFFANTSSWKEASDYVYLIRYIELLDANGNVIKTIDKNTKPASNPASKPSTKPTSKPTTATTKVTRDPKLVTADKKAAQKAMKQAKITKLTVKSKAKKKIAVTWKKVKKAKGYEVEVNTNKKFKKSKTVLSKITSKKKLTIKSKKLKSKKTYYVRVRAYATYNNANNTAVKVYSAWNKKIRKVTVK